MGGDMHEWDEDRVIAVWNKIDVQYTQIGHHKP
jgi:hypothetical protein